MFIWDWFTGVLGYLGLTSRKGKYIFTGLPGSGKCSLIKHLEEEGLIDFTSFDIQYSQSNRDTLNNSYRASEELSIGNIRFTTFDLGGHSQARRVWKDYFPAVDAIVFLIDAFDRTRFRESKKELDSLLTDETLANCPILILGNKIDITGAASEDELRTYFALYNQTTGKGKVPRSELPGRPLELFMCSILRKQGYGDGFRWIAQYMD
ncbi:GTP-binding protein SAR1A isoform X1 [Harmonia axyridis]|uniref:GTP-binding protein SAR1A isoform X1 n=1 Tax=Harmonia axyridis TaxID=115357 RepID=UPI001E276030|nr:GTP-binding protein SAR1A isoform X1 [Harmonia axyridis]